MSETRKQCPVCGGDLGKRGIVEPDACPLCRFPFARASRFADSRGLETWNRMVRDRRRNLLRDLQAKCREDRSFLLTGGTLVCRLPEERTVTLVKPDGLQVLNDPPAVQYSAAENTDRNAVRLLEDGTVSASGDNSYAQCETGGMTGIRRVLATSTCTYGITEASTVVFSGQPVSAAAADWKNIVDLAAGAYHLAGLTIDGRVLLAGEMLNPNVVQEISGWMDVTAISASGDATLALKKNGTVAFAGKAGDSRRKDVLQWSNITSIALESVYAVALTAEGNVLLAGRNQNDFLDLGRKDAANWNDIIAITCSRSAIGALGFDGTLYLAGNLREKDRIQLVWEKIRPRLMEQLIRSVCDSASGLRP